jgi:hypothetical protein
MGHSDSFPKFKHPVSKQTNHPWRKNHQKFFSPWALRFAMLWSYERWAQTGRRLRFRKHGREQPNRGYLPCDHHNSQMLSSGMRTDDLSHITSSAAPSAPLSFPSQTQSRPNTPPPHPTPPPKTSQPPSPASPAPSKTPPRGLSPRPPST